VEEAGDRVWEKLQAEMEKHDLSLRSLYGDGWNAPRLEQDDFQILTAASVLDEQATGWDIICTVEKWAGCRPNSLRLDGLVAEGLLVSLQTADWPEYYRLTELGERALARAKAEGTQLVNARVVSCQQSAVQQSAVQQSAFSSFSPVPKADS